MNRLHIIWTLSLLVAVAACQKKDQPQANPAGADQPEAPAGGGAETSYFKNPSPPFTVELGKAESESPAAEILEGNRLRLPILYREWIFVGSRLVAGTQTVFENFYLHPRHYQAFLQNHAWPEQMVVVRERVASKPQAADVTMGAPSGVSVAVRDAKRFPEQPGGWAFYDFGTSYPPANSASPGGRAWLESADALLEFCPVLRGIKR